MNVEERAEAILVEYRERLERGDAVDAEAVIRENPDLADALRPQFAAMRLLGRAYGRDDSPAASPAGRAVGAYRLIREIGRGGQAAVYLADDTRLPRKVALKVFAAGLIPSPQSLARFRREADAASRLDHPDICTIHEAGVDGDTPYIAMRHVEGRTLAEWIEASRASGNRRSRTSTIELPSASDTPSSETASPVLRVVALIERVARALHFAHEAGLVHRDVKPGNVMVTRDGGPVLLDFGLAREDDVNTLTMTGSLVGTPAYMSPEQLLGQSLKVDRRTDVYSLGVTLYECLTLKRPFDAPTREALYQQILSSSADSPRRANPQISRDLEVVVQTAMAKDRDGRYRTALDFAEDLARLRRHEPIRARPTLAHVRLSRWAQRHPGVATGVASAFVLMALGLGVTTYFLAQSREEQRRTEAALTHARAMALSSAAAASMSSSDPLTAVLLAREATRIEPSRHTFDQLREAVFRCPERVVLTGHSGAVHDATFSPAGDRVATASADHTARLWDLRGNLIAKLEGHGDGVVDVAFSAQGDRIVTASHDRTARIWDLAGSDPVVLRGHEDRVTRASFSPDGTCVLTASDDGTARVWSGSGEPTLILEGGGGDVDAARFSPDGSRVLTATSAGAARVWDLAGKELSRFDHAPRILDAVFAPRGDRIATAGFDHALRLWSVAGAELAATQGHAGRIQTVEFSPDGERLVSGSNDFTARVWSADGKELALLKGHKDKVLSASFAPLGDRIVTASLDGVARIWDVHGRELLVLRGHEPKRLVAAFSPTDDRVVTASDDGTAAIWNLAGKELAVLRGHSGPVTSAVFSPAGDVILTASADATARTWDTNGGKLRSFPPHDGPVYCARYSPQGDRIATASFDRTARVHDLDGTELAQFAEHEASVMSVCFSPDGLSVVTASNDTTARSWRASGGAIRMMKGHKWEVLSAVFSPDGAQILTAGLDGTARVWGVSGEQCSLPTRTKGRLTSAVFSPSADRVAASSDDGKVIVWDREWNVLATLDGHEGSVTSVEFSSDGEFLVTASSDQTARIWSAAGEELAVLRGHAGPLATAAFDRDARRVVTASADGTARLWCVRNEDVLSLAGLRLTRDFTQTERERYGDLLGQASADMLEAERAVERLTPGTMLVAELRDRITRESSLSEGARASALGMIATRRDDPVAIRFATWAIVQSPSRSPDEYELALRRLEVAEPLDPGNGDLLCVLGIARYRSGLHIDAIRTLERAAAIHATYIAAGTVPDVTFLAMSCHESGDRPRARAYLIRLREMMKAPDQVKNALANHFLAEAEALVGGD